MNYKIFGSFTAQQGKFGSQWLNVVFYKNLRLKLDDKQLPSGASNICVAHNCHCGKRVERDGLQGLSCTKRAGLFSRHVALHLFMKQTLGSHDLPSMLNQRGLHGIDGKRQNVVTMTS